MAVIGLSACSVTLSTSRCDDFQSTLEQLAADPGIGRIGATLITHRFDQSQLPAAFQTARERDCLKALVTPGDQN